MTGGCFLLGGLIFTVGAATTIGFILGLIRLCEWLDDNFGWVGPTLLLILGLMLLGGLILGPEFCKK